jgi:hypothetical protein
VEAIPERLALISYIVEYAYVHDDRKKPIMLQSFNQPTKYYSH